MTQLKLKRPQPVMTYILIVLCILIYAVDRLTAFTMFGRWGYGLLSYAGMRMNDRISSGEWWRLVTPMFLHGSLLHLGMNCLGLYVWGRYMERLYGPWRYGLLLLASGFMGNVMGYAFSSYDALGISGAIFGIFGMLLALWKENRQVFKALFGVQVFIYAGANLLLGFMNKGVDNWGHVGGMLGGFLAGLVVGLPWTKKETIKQIAAGMSFLAVSAFLIAVGRGLIF
ncbi:MAG: rhomboid family intramembrane serine protease [Christensenellales bacterium]|jgi:rhomboid protease GluP